MKNIDQIEIKGARSNNLKNISVTIPKNKLVVVTGVSGSGKSSLTMDTLYADGQRRYVESLSSYARQFLMRMKKPEVDMIHGICPAIAIEQKVTSSNNRSTVGSLTEIQDYLRLLFARIGKTYSPISGNLVSKHQVSDVIDELKKHIEQKVAVYIPIQTKYSDRTLQTELDLLLQRGYNRVLWNGKLERIENILEEDYDLSITIADNPHDIRILIDRFVINDDEENWKRIADSVSVAFYESGGDCWLNIGTDIELKFNNRFELDGMTFLEPSTQMFNHNNSYGACPTCEGYGKIIGLDKNKVIPNKSLSVYEGAISCWTGEKHGQWLQTLIKNAHHFDFPIHKPYCELSKAEQKLLWKGNKYFLGIDAFFKEAEAQIYKIQYRVLLSRFRGRTDCNNCEGSRLRPEALYVKINDVHIAELLDLPINELQTFFKELILDETDTEIAKRLLLEIENRLLFMMDVGLGYLNLNRVSGTLSGGETQRINLTRTLGSNLTSSMYILDEPSIGLHPKDTNRLIKVLKSLRDLGNTVIVVEHEEDVIRNSDYLIDVGPEAGVHGGEIVYAGDFNAIEFSKNGRSLTTQYLTNIKEIVVPSMRRVIRHKLFLKNVHQFNLKNINVTIPINILTVVTGVSGSGKTTLIKKVLYPELQKHLGQNGKESIGESDGLSGDTKLITGVEMVNQSPIGKSSRSNPVTYVKAYDAIRSLMANKQLSKIRGYQPKHFSFNVDGGRCDACKGEGEQVVEMQFLADIRLECEVCKGKRFKKETLLVKHNEKNIADILDMTVDEAIVFFEGHKDILKKLQPLQDVGLGYVCLGQSSSSLSGGEAQRVKLASFLSKDSSGHIFFIFDEPTTGLHFHDILKLLKSLNALVEKGHTVLVVEHNLDVIKCADYIIDLGPGGGKNGGELIFQGTPEELIKEKRSFTGQYLKEKIS